MKRFGSKTSDQCDADEPRKETDGVIMGFRRGQWENKVEAKVLCIFH